MEDDNDVINYPNQPPAAYEQLQSVLGEALQQTSGSQQKAIDAQMKNAEAARQNAMKIAQLQASTSRYGIDAQSATAMRALKENARQFDAQHGLDIAKAYTAFSSTPDMMFARNDFMNAMGRVGQGLNPAPVASEGTPHAKTWEDFSAIAQYNGSTIPGGGSGGGKVIDGQVVSASSTPAGGGEAKDPRVGAANSIVKALPPSDEQGHDGQDWAALNAIQSLYSAGKPGLQRLGAARTKIAMAGLARLGYDPALMQEEYNRGLPNQGSPIRAA